MSANAVATDALLERLLAQADDPWAVIRDALMRSGLATAEQVEGLGPWVLADCRSCKWADDRDVGTVCRYLGTTPDVLDWQWTPRGKRAPVDTPDLRPVCRLYERGTSDDG